MTWNRTTVVVILGAAVALLVGGASGALPDVDLPQNFDGNPDTWSNGSDLDDERELDQRSDLLEDREMGDPLVGL